MDVTWESLVGLVKARYAAVNEIRKGENGAVPGRQWGVG